MSNKNLPASALLVFCLIALSLPATAQTQKIGDVLFLHEKTDDKPPRTLSANVEVFENNIAEKGPKIRLYIEVVPARDSVNKADPMFIIMGGPGQAATDLVSFFNDIFAPINEKSDLVFIDQRGTGKSNPLQLRGQYTTLSDYFKDDFMSDQIISESFRLLKAENDLKQYGTANAIRDIETVRKQLGYGRINIYGTSYGTRVSVAYINAYPNRVRTATLKGLVPHDLVIPVDFASDAQRSLDILIEDCAQDSSCNQAFPNLRAGFDKFFGSLPVKFEMTNPQTDAKEEVSLSRDIAALNLRVLLMSPSSTATVPYLITEFNKKNFEPLANVILSIKKSYQKGIYDGMTLCVICHEDYPELPSTTFAAHENSFLGDYWVRRIINACEIWNPSKERAPRSDIRPRNIPVLLISGNRDAATPPGNGQRVLQYFPNGRHVVVNAGSHSFDGMRNCVDKLICEFVIKGSAQSLNTECAAGIKFPEYKVR